MRPLLSIQYYSSSEIRHDCTRARQLPERASPAKLRSRLNRAVLQVNGTQRPRPRAILMYAYTCSLVSRALFEMMSEVTMSTKDSTGIGWSYYCRTVCTVAKNAHHNHPLLSAYSRMPKFPFRQPFALHQALPVHTVILCMTRLRPPISLLGSSARI